MSGIDNLKVPTHDEAVRYGRMGGRKKAENEAIRKTFKECISWILDQDFEPGTDEENELLDRFPDLTKREAIAISLSKRAINGDVRAVEFMRDTMGEESGTTAKRNETSEKMEIHITVID